MSTRPTAAAGIEAAVNRVLALDPELFEAVAELEGSVFEIHIRGVETRVQLHPSASGIGVVTVGGDEQTPVAPDVTVSGPPFTLLRLLGSLESVNGVLPPEVSITGELALVHWQQAQPATEAQIKTYFQEQWDLEVPTLTPLQQSWFREGGHQSRFAAPDGLIWLRSSPMPEGSHQA